jgi:ABC-type nitrate/sulfonate/bicarbonate transport system substrate-binding protein
MSEKFSRRDFIRMAGATALTAPVLAACGSPPQQTAAPVEAPSTGSSDTGTGLAPGQRGGLWLPPEPPEIKSVVTAVDTPSYFTNVAWRIMLDRGFVEEEGFDKVDMIVADGTFEGLVSKDITMVGNLDADNVMVSVNEGVPIRAVATHRDHEWHIAGLSPSIKKPTDLIGRQAMVGSPGTRTFAQYKDHVFKWSGGEVDIERDMEHISISGGSDARQQALIADQVQIANIYSRHLAGLKEGGAAWVVFGWFEFPQEAISVHADTVANAPRTIINLLRAYLKAWTVMMNYGEKDQIDADMTANHDMGLAADFKSSWTSQMDDFAPMGYFRPQAMKFFLDDLANFDIVSRDVRYQDFYNTTFLQQAQLELFGNSWPPTDQNDLFTNEGYPLDVLKGA